MSHWRCSFQGRTNGAIGIVSRYTIHVEADTREAARLKIYDTHEHLSGVEITLVQWQVTCVMSNGLRTLTCAAQGREMYPTREQAEEHLRNMLANNSADRLASVFGTQAIGTFRVDAFDCWDHGDPKGVYAS